MRRPVFIRFFPYPPSRAAAGLGVALALGLAWQASAPVVLAHGTLHERQARLMAEIEAQPGDALLRCRLAELFCEHGDYPEARGALADAERLDPGLALADLVRGDLLLRQEASGEARAALDRYLQRSPGDPRGFLLRARALSALGEPAAALADYRSALRLERDPEPDLYQEAADALAANGLADEAIAVLETGLRARGPIPSLTLRAMDLEVAAGRFDAALARVDLLQKDAPQPEPWMARRAELLARAGRPGEARAAWQALLDHLAALPNLKRGSHAMSRLAEQARQALAAP